VHSALTCCQQVVPVVIVTYIRYLSGTDLVKRKPHKMKQRCRAVALLDAPVTGRTRLLANRFGVLFESYRRPLLWCDTRAVLRCAALCCAASARLTLSAARYWEYIVLLRRAITVALIAALTNHVRANRRQRAVAVAVAVADRDCRARASRAQRSVMWSAVSFVQVVALLVHVLVQPFRSARQRACRPSPRALSSPAACVRACVCAADHGEPRRDSESGRFGRALRDSSQRSDPRQRRLCHHHKCVCDVCALRCASPRSTPAALGA
jgi:hypothetical protein